MMFEVGKWYRIEERFGEDTTMFTRGEALEWQHPLLKLKEDMTDREIIINTSAATFRRAHPIEKPDLEGVKASSDGKPRGRKIRNRGPLAV